MKFNQDTSHYLKERMNQSGDGKADISQNWYFNKYSYSFFDKHTEPSTLAHADIKEILFDVFRCYADHSIEHGEL